ncbi:MAG TPA: deoxyribodipyrimidine photo-lyase, partial [Polyangiaceae bacterium]|nr:deoxyribodipyrimidine photo-lyase [Polyangiaceae bacterium]
MRTLVWFRGKDLRLDDHEPLSHALEQGEVIPLFVLDPYFFAPERAQRIAHRIQFLLDSLSELAREVERCGSRLLLVEGKSHEVIPDLARRLRVDQVVGQRWSEPFARRRDERVKALLHVPFLLFEGETLSPPGTLRSQSGGPFTVFTPFARAFAREARVSEPLARPTRLPSLPPDVELPSRPVPTCETLGFARNAAVIHGGEIAAQARLDSFLAGAGPKYHEQRDRLDLAATSRLSADLKFGTLSPRRVWHAVEKALLDAPLALRSLRNELTWREFTHSTLVDFPSVLETPFRPAFRD